MTGRENEFMAWLTKHGVKIVHHRSFVREQLAELGRQKGNPHFEAALSGAFSRVELPEIVARAFFTQLRRILHGPKPYQQDLIESQWPELKSLTGGACLAQAKKWAELLAEAR